MVTATATANLEKLVEGVPYVKQKQDTSCGFANLAMLLNFYGIAATEEELYKYSDCPRKQFVSGSYETNPLELATICSQFLSEKGIKAQLEFYLPDMDDILESRVGRAYGSINSASELMEKGKKYLAEAEKILGVKFKPIRPSSILWTFPRFSEREKQEKIDICNGFLYKLGLLENLTASTDFQLHLHDSIKPDEAKHLLDQGTPFILNSKGHWWTVVGYRADEWNSFIPIVHNSLSSPCGELPNSCVRDYRINGKIYDPVFLIRPKPK